MVRAWVEGNTGGSETEIDPAGGVYFSEERGGYRQRERAYYSGKIFLWIIGFPPFPCLGNRNYGLVSQYFAGIVREEVLFALGYRGQAFNSREDKDNCNDTD